MSLFQNTFSPRHYTLRTLQLVTWACYGLAVLSLCLFVWLFLRVGLQWTAVAMGSGELRRQREATASLTSEIQLLQRDLQIQHHSGVWLAGVPDLAAQLEHTAKAYHVSLTSVAPEGGESDATADESPSDDYPLRSQRIIVRASGPYKNTVAWMQLLATPKLPIRMEAITVTPSKSNGETGLSVELQLIFFRQKGHSKE